MLFMLTTGDCDFFWGGFLSCGLPASSAMSGLTLSMHLGYPSSIPGSGDGVRKAYFFKLSKIAKINKFGWVLLKLQVTQLLIGENVFYSFKVVILLW